MKFYIATWCLRHNIYSAWFLDLRISTSIMVILSIFIIVILWGYSNCITFEICRATIDLIATCVMMLVLLGIMLPLSYNCSGSYVKVLYQLVPVYFSIRLFSEEVTWYVGRNGHCLECGPFMDKIVILYIEGQ